MMQNFCLVFQKSDFHSRAINFKFINYDLITSMSLLLSAVNQ